MKIRYLVCPLVLTLAFASQAEDSLTEEGVESAREESITLPSSVNESQFDLNDILRGVSIGLSYSTVELFISENSDEDNENNSATMSSAFVLTPVIGYSTDLNKFGDSNFGYYLETIWKEYELDRQSLNGTDSPMKLSDVSDPDLIDLGTSIKGTTLAVTPILAYEIPILMGINMQLGMGFGLGYLSVKGSYYETDEAASEVCRSSTTIAELKSSCLKQKVNDDGFTTSVGFLAKLSYKNLSLSAVMSGPGFSNYDYNEVAVVLNYRFGNNQLK